MVARIGRCSRDDAFLRRASVCLVLKARLQEEGAVLNFPRELLVMSEQAEASRHALGPAAWVLTSWRARVRGSSVGIVKSVQCL